MSVQMKLHKHGPIAAKPGLTVLLQAVDSDYEEFGMLGRHEGVEPNPFQRQAMLARQIELVINDTGFIKISSQLMNAVFDTGTFKIVDETWEYVVLNLMDFIARNRLAGVYRYGVWTLRPVNDDNRVLTIYWDSGFPKPAGWPQPPFLNVESK